LGMDMRGLYGKMGCVSNIHWRKKASRADGTQDADLTRKRKSLILKDRRFCPHAGGLGGSSNVAKESWDRKT